jgi:hypothetical protein
MVNFENVVRRSLFEMATEKPVESDAETINKSVVFLSNKPLTDFNQIYTKFYKPILDKSSFETLLAVISKSANQTNYVQGDFEKYIEFFPYVDFITDIIQTAIGQDKPFLNKFVPAIHGEAALLATKNYIKYFQEKAVAGGWTLDYPCKTARSLILQTDLRKKQYGQVVGSLALQNYYNKSLQVTIFSLLNARKKARDPQNTTPNASNYIQQILLTPEKFAGGKIKVPQEFSRIYEQTSVQQLMKIGVAIKNFYNFEKSNKQRLLDQQNEGRKITTSIEDFFSNSTVTNDTFKWEADGQSQLDLAGLTFNGLLQLIEDTQAEFSFDQAPTQAEFPFSQDKSLTKPETPKEWDNKLKPEAPQTNTNPLDGPTGGGYNIKNIKSMTNVDSAVELYKELENLANYIKEVEAKKGPDIAGALKGATRAVKGLSLGV